MTITEAQFQTDVIEAAMWCGWKVQHTRAARTPSGGWSTPIAGHIGFPDLVLAHPTRGVIFAELKRDTGRLSPAQTEWLDTLFRAGAEAYVWRPRDWETILTRLQGDR